MEDTLSGLDTYLTTAIPAKITVIEAERTVTIPDLVAIDTGRVKDRAYPYMELRPGKVKFDYGDTTEPLASDPMEVHEVTVAIRHTGSEEAAVQLVLCRYEEALRRVMLDDNTCGSRFNWARIEEISFVAVTDAQDRKKLLKELRASLWVEVVR